MKLKDKVKGYRAKHCLTIAEMAKLCGVSPTTLLHVEKGYGKPNLKTVGKVNKILNGGD